MNRNVPLYQLLLSLFITFLGGVGIWIGTQRELESLSKTQEFQQKQIDEIKASSNELKATVKGIETSVGDMRGDIKVILSRISAPH